MTVSFQKALNTGHMVAIRMISESASRSHEVRIRNPSRLSIPASSPVSERRASRAIQKERATEMRMKRSRGTPTPPEPKACTDCTTPLRTR